MPAEAKKQLNPLLKLALEMGPLILFFFANSRPGLFLPFVGPLLPAAVSGEKAGIFVATAVFMVAILIALAVSYALTRHLPVMAMVTAVVVVVFGSAHAGAARRDLHQDEADHHLRAVRRRSCSAGCGSTSRCSRSCSTRCSI